MCACAHVCRCLWTPEEGIESSGAGITESMSQCGWLGQNLSPLEVKHSLFSTEPSLQPLDSTICIRGSTMTGW